MDASTASQSRLRGPHGGTRVVLLIGGGHAHIEVIRRWAEKPPERASLSVVDPNPRPIYSGMVPGYLAGQYRRRDLEFDLAQLCQRAEGQYLPCAVTAIDAGAHCVVLSDGREVHYDLASLDIGSSVAGKEVPGVADFALPPRPIAAFLERIDGFVERVLADGLKRLPVQVVGGGAGGVELAFCLDARLRNSAQAPVRVEIATDAAHLLKGSGASAVAATEQEASRRGIRTHRNARVIRMGKDVIDFEDGRQLPCGGVLWATGPAAHPLASASGLPVDQRGFLRIDSTFQVEGQDALFAVGDCASLEGMKKAGVYAVRSGPLIDANLRARLSGAMLQKYEPQREFLSLLNLGNGEAIGTKWGRTFKGRSMMWLKDRIDRSFMEKYR